MHIKFQPLPILKDGKEFVTWGLRFCLESTGESETGHRQTGQGTHADADAPWTWAGFRGHQSFHSSDLCLGPVVVDR